MTLLNIDISDQNCMHVVRVLHQLLADEYVLYTKTRNYHWNVSGPHFYDRHKFFEGQYEALDQIIDDVAERARSLGGPAIGTLAEFLKLTKLKEQPGIYPDAKSMNASLLEDHEAVIRSLRESQEVCNSKLQDAGTGDFLIGLMAQHEKMAWMLRVSL